MFIIFKKFNILDKSEKRLCGRGQWKSLLYQKYNCPGSKS